MVVGDAQGVRQVDVTACVLNSGEYQLFWTDKSPKTPKTKYVSLSLPLHPFVCFFLVQLHFESLYSVCICVIKLSLYFSCTSSYTLLTFNLIIYPSKRRTHTCSVLI